MEIIHDRTFLRIEMISADENNLWQEILADRDDFSR